MQRLTHFLIHLLLWDLTNVQQDDSFCSHKRAYSVKILLLNLIAIIFTSCDHFMFMRLCEIYLYKNQNNEANAFLEQLINDQPTLFLPRVSTSVSKKV